MKERIIRVAKYITIILVIGFSYAGICYYTGFGIPCLFRSITGYKCAGCGITHMFLALLRLDFKTAFSENQFAFILMPVCMAGAGYHIFQYIQNGFVKIKKSENVLCYIIIAMLVIWGIIRNFKI